MWPACKEWLLILFQDPKCSIHLQQTDGQLVPIELSTLPVVTNHRDDEAFEEGRQRLSLALLVCDPILGNLTTVATIFAAKCNWTVNSSQSNLSQLYSSPKGRETKTLPLFGPWPDSAGFIKLFAGRESRGAAWGLKVLETASPPFCYSLWRSTNTQLYISKYT